ncbi:MAG TPA: transposase [Prolixibacteraceae bacterium]|nr:transposase [Prolixibacteraceae bacterium]
MEATQEQLLSILELILPREILEYFTITNLTNQPTEVHLFLDERNEVPDEYKGEKLVSKGFHPESVIQDFPLRNKALYLHVRRRKWEVESSKKIVSKTWNLSANGTRYSNEFAAFLKGLLGYLPDKF